MSIKSRVENCIRRLYRKHVEDDIDTVQNQIQNIKRRNNMTKKYPSQKKYEAENPTLTIRLKKREKEKIKEMSEISETSVSDLARVSLLDLHKDFSKAYEDAQNQGYEIGFEEGDKNGYGRGKEEWGIQFPCAKCGKLEYIPSNSPCHQAVLEFFKEHGWAHGECPKD